MRYHHGSQAGPWQVNSLLRTLQSLKAESLFTPSRPHPRPCQLQVPGNGIEGRPQAPHRGSNKIRPLEQLCLSTQCGFASTEVGNAITFDDQRRKLELVVTTAEEVWGSAA